MRSLIIAALFLLGLTGCAPQSRFGNFIEQQAVLDQTQLARDAITKIIALFPPGKTRFELQQPTLDRFGMALVRGLREHGYAVLEFAPEPVSIIPNKPATNSTSSTLEKKAVTNVSSQSAALPLHYVIDQLAGTELYRVTIQAGNSTLSRAYRQKNAVVTPAGSWAYKE